MGGGKSAGAPPPEPQDNSAMLMMMMNMMGQQQQQPMMLPQQPMMASLPEIENTAPIDWKSQSDALKTSAAADLANNKRKGRLRTIHSSKTDDGEETEMSTSLLNEENK